MNETIEILKQHRTIRNFTEQPVDEATVQAMLDATLQTATSRATQNASLIRVRDQVKREALAQVSAQSYTARSPEYFVFIVDCARSAAILAEKGLDPSTAGNMDYFREGFTDAILMTQTMTVAAETLGLGTTQLGSILNDPERTIEILGLPKYTFPALGLIFGHPNQDPQLKPRIPKNLRVMTDTYTAPESWCEALADYDREMNHYYDTRKLNQREDCFTDQILQKMGATPKGERLIKAIRAQGFAI